MGDVERTAKKIISSFDPRGCAASQEPVVWAPRAWTNRFGMLTHVPPGFIEKSRISRLDLLELGRSDFPDDDALREFFIVIMAWGYGRSPRGPWRVEQMLNTDDAVARIRRAVEVTRSEGAKAGFRSLAIRDDSRLAWLGPAFGTKLLYFAAYSEVDPPRPLILDQYVGKTLDEWEFFLHYNHWNADHYEKYLLLAEEIASRSDCEPHDVECWLFQEGRRLDSAS